MEKKKLVLMIGRPQVAIAYADLQRKLLSHISNYHTAVGDKSVAVDLGIDLSYEDEQILENILRYDGFYSFFSKTQFHNPISQVTRVSLKLD